MRVRTSWYPARQFAVLRSLLGAYLAVRYARLLPYADELFGPGGMPVTPSARGLPNPLILEPGLATAFLILLLLAAITFAAGLARRASALVSWYGLACLLAKNTSITEPSIEFIGWLLLATVLVPLGEGLAPGRWRPDPDWHMPPALYYGAWTVFAVAYGMSGWAKLSSAAWTGGSALADLAAFPAAHPWAAAIPAFASRPLTWLALSLELLCPLLSLHRLGRALAWVGLSAMHLAMMVVLAGAEVALGMLLFHLFLFDRRWLSMGTAAR